MLFRSTFAVRGDTIDISISGGGSGGIGTNISGASGFTYVDQSGKIITSNIIFDSTNSGTSNSYILLNEQKMIINSGIGVTIGTGKLLVINPFDLPNPLT